MSSDGRPLTDTLLNSTDDPVELEPPFPIIIVEEMLRSLVKAMRANQLYLRNNPMHQRALDACRAAFDPVWEQTEEVTLVVNETDMRWYGHRVIVEIEKASDSLPWLLYKDGIRELQIMRGFDDEELVRLLDIIQRVRRASPDEDDLISLLWEQDFASLRYKYVEVAPDAMEGIERSSFVERRVEVPAATTSAAEAASGIVDMSEFDSTLYFLDAAEIAYIQSEFLREYNSDIRTNVTAILLDIFEQQSGDSVRSEIIELLDYYLVHLLSTNGFGAVSSLIRECAEAAARAGNLTPEHKEKLEHLPRRLSDREVLLQMLQALDDSSRLPSQDDLADLFAQLRGEALEVLLGFIGRSQNSALKPLLEGAADRLAATSTAEIVRLINIDDRDVRLEAMRRAGALKTTVFVAPLARALAHTDPEIRLGAVTALNGIASPGALQALEKSVEDRSREVRIGAVRALATHTFRPALSRVESCMKGKQLREADLTEKMAFFEAYGALAGEPGIQFLDGILNGRGLFGNREDSEVRACAAMALGRIGSDRALSSLQKASGEKDPVVRNAINKAFRGTAP